MNKETLLKDFKNSTLEAIYWWNRDESYYHKYFYKIDDIYKNKEMLNFFTIKIFEVFLREYSIRRNLSKGFENVDKLIIEIVKNGFVAEVKNGNTDIIDIVSTKLKNSKITNERQTKSLLSKIAFLINPNDFSLFDNLAKKSLWSIVKNKKQIKKHELDYYSKFLKQTNIQIKENSEIITEQTRLLNSFKETEAYFYFSRNNKAFERRIYDKYLWLKEQNNQKNNRIIKNSIYNEFIKL